MNENRNKLFCKHNEVQSEKKGIFRTRRQGLREHYILYHDMSLGYGHIVLRPMPPNITEAEKLE